MVPDEGQIEVTLSKYHDSQTRTCNERKFIFSHGPEWVAERPPRKYLGRNDNEITLVFSARQTALTVKSSINVTRPSTAREQAVCVRGIGVACNGRLR